MGQIEIPKSSSDFVSLRKPIKHLTGAAKWKDIEDLINRWAKRNKRGAFEQDRWLKETRDELVDKKNAKWAQGFGGAHGRIDAETKYSVLIHPELMNYIQVFYPTFMDTKEELHEFMHRFPKFKIRSEI